jgi:hypothetical protein
MAAKKLSELPDFYAKELAMEAQRRGVEVLGTHITAATDLMLIGLCQLVADLQSRVEYLEENQR